MLKLPKAVQNERRSHVALGDQARDSGDWIEAVNHYKLHLENKPNDFGIWVQLGNCSKEARQYETSFKAYEKAKKINDKDADLFLQLGHLFKLMSNKPEAVLAYQQALTIRPDLGAAKIELDSLSRDDLFHVAALPPTLVNFVSAESLPELIEQARCHRHLGDPFQVYLSSVIH